MLIIFKKRFALKHLSLFLKIVTSAILMTILAYVVGIEGLIKRLSSINIFIMMAVVFLLCLQNIVASLRWNIIIKQLGSHLPFKDVFSIYVIGSIANIVFLTSVGGLSIRTLLLVQQGVGFMHVAVGLFIERIFVFAALLVSFFLGAYILKVNSNLEIIDRSVFYAFILLFVVFAFILLAFLIIKFGKLEHGRKVSELFGAVFKPSLPFSMLIIVSLLVLFLGFAAIGIIAWGLDIDVPILLLLSIQPVIAVAAGLPVSFGGWGVREGSMVLGLSLLHIGSEDALALSILYGLSGVISTLLLASVAVISGLGDDVVKSLAEVRKKGKK